MSSFTFNCNGVAVTITTNGVITAPVEGNALWINLEDGFKGIIQIAPDTGNSDSEDKDKKPTMKEDSMAKKFTKKDSISSSKGAPPVMQKSARVAAYRLPDTTETARSKEESKIIWLKSDSETDDKLDENFAETQQM
jgi:hypothetical protein